MPSGRLGKAGLTARWAASSIQRISAPITLILIIAIRVLIIAIRVLIIAIRVLIIAIRVLIIAIRVLIIAIRALIIAIRRSTRERPTCGGGPHARLGRGRRSARGRARRAVRLVPTEMQQVFEHDGRFPLQRDVYLCI